MVNPDNDTVSVFDAVTRAKMAEINVGAAPRTLALTPSGSAMWVVNKRAATISVISTASLAVTQTIALPRASSPYGVAMAAGTSNVALVALEGTGVLLKLNASDGADTGQRVGRTEPAPRGSVGRWCNRLCVALHHPAAAR